MGKKALFNQFISIVSEEMARHVFKKKVLFWRQKSFLELLEQAMCWTELNKNRVRINKVEIDSCVDFVTFLLFFSTSSLDVERDTRFFSLVFWRILVLSFNDLGKFYF